MTKGKIKHLIRFVMPVFAIIAWVVVIDFYVLPPVLKNYIIKYKTISNRGYYNLVDENNVHHNVDAFVYNQIQDGDYISVKASLLFRHGISIINNRTGISSPLLFDYEFNLIIFITIIFLLWFVLKWLRDTFYFLFLIPYIAINFYFWVYLNSMKF